MNAAEMGRADAGDTTKALDNELQQTPDYSGTSPATQMKRRANAVALGALHGVTVYCIEGDFQKEVFIATKWALTREFTDLDSLETWLHRVTGRQA